MSRGPQTFRQRDLSAAIKTAKAAGCEVARVEVGKDGHIIVILANANEQPSNKAGCSVRNVSPDCLAAKKANSGITETKNPRNKTNARLPTLSVGGGGCAPSTLIISHAPESNAANQHISPRCELTCASGFVRRCSGAAKVNFLRGCLDELTSRAAIDRWIAIAVKESLDPL